MNLGATELFHSVTPTGSGYIYPRVKFWKTFQTSSPAHSLLCLPGSPDHPPRRQPPPPSPVPRRRRPPPPASACLCPSSAVDLRRLSRLCRPGPELRRPPPRSPRPGQLRPPPRPFPSDSGRSSVLLRRARALRRTSGQRTSASRAPDPIGSLSVDFSSPPPPFSPSHNL